MEQPWNQMEGGYAMGVVGGDSCPADLDHSMAEVDGALLMKLMEDLPSSDFLLPDGDVDRLSHVIRSLESEISGGGGEAAASMVPDENEESFDRIEDVLSDDDGIHGYEGGSSSFGYWPQVSSMLAAGHETEGWCVYADNGYGAEGVVLGYDDDTVDAHQYYCSWPEASVDHMYSPLWE